MFVPAFSSITSTSVDRWTPDGMWSFLLMCVSVRIGRCHYFQAVGGCVHQDCPFVKRQWGGGIPLTQKWPNRSVVFFEAVLLSGASWAGWPRKKVLIAAHGGSAGGYGKNSMMLYARHRKLQLWLEHDPMTELLKQLTCVYVRKCTCGCVCWPKTNKQTEENARHIKSVFRPINRTSH